MKTKSLRMVLDILMTVLFMFLLNMTVTGIQLHEVMGLGIFFLIFSHNILNFNWLKSITLNLGKGKVKGNSKFRYALDALLLIFILVITVTGILMSEALFPSLNAGNHALWYSIHTISSYICGGLLLVHIGLHYRFFVNFYKQVFHGKPFFRMASAFIAALGIMYLLIFTVMENVAKNNILAPVASSSVPYSTGSGTVISGSSTQSPSSDKSSGSTITDGTTKTSAPTLSEYLGNLVCTGCGKRCSLLSPRCNKGQAKAEQAEETYYSTYGQDAAE